MSSTMQDVADAAGVSLSTVSRVFTEPTAVRQTTRDRVLSAAGRLRYDPKPRARVRERHQALTLGMIVPDISSPFFGVMAKAVQTRAHTRGCTVLLGDSDERATDEYDLAMAMIDRIDGLLLVSSQMPEQARAIVTSKVPCTILNQDPGGLPSVLATSADGILQAVEHLWALGHRRVGFVNGPQVSWSNRHRQAAVREATSVRGMELTEFGPFASNFDSGLAAADQVLAEDVTGVIAHNDLMAMGLLKQFGRRGVVVPEQISVIGVDDIWMAVTCNPALTTVRLPLREMGVAGVDVMVKSLTDPSGPPTELRLASSLVVRESTAAVSNGRWSSADIQRRRDRGTDAARHETEPATDLT